MRTTQRIRRAGLAAVTAIVIGGGVAIGATAIGSAASGSTAAATPGPVAPGNYADPASYAGVVRQVLPSVVLIRPPDGLVSGVVLDRSGNIVTYAHVARSTTKFQVQVAGGTAPRSARLVGTYPPDDLPVIRADDPSGLQPARFGDSDRAQAGDVVLTIGNPLGPSGSVTEGIISATDAYSLRGAAPVGLTPPDQLGVPAQHGTRRDDQLELAEATAGYKPGQRGQDCAVGPGQLRCPDLALEHGDLVAQDEDLSVARSDRASRARQPNTRNAATDVPDWRRDTWSHRNSRAGHL